MKTGLDRAILTAFSSCRTRALKRGQIWALTLEQFESIWDGHWIARRHHSLKLGLIDPSLGFAVGNVRITSRAATRERRFRDADHNT